MQRRCRILRAPRQALQCVLPSAHAFHSVPCQRIGALEGTSLAFVPLPCSCIHDAWFFASFPFVDAPRASPTVVVLLCPLLVVQDSAWRLNPRGRLLPFPGSVPFQKGLETGFKPGRIPFRKGAERERGRCRCDRRPSSSITTCARLDWRRRTCSNAVETWRRKHLRPRCRTCWTRPR